MNNFEQFQLRAEIRGLKQELRNLNPVTVAYKNIQARVTMLESKLGTGRAQKTPEVEITR